VILLLFAAIHGAKAAAMNFASIADFPEYKKFLEISFGGIKNRE
jgi:hypothetical protein